MADETEETDPGRDARLAELADGSLAGDRLRDELGGAPGGESAAAEVEAARRVRGLMLSLREAEVEVPADFEARLLARVREEPALLGVVERVRADPTLLDLLELYLDGFGGALVELLNALLSLLPPGPRDEPAAA
jgi:hypothetical protein